MEGSHVEGRLARVARARPPPGRRGGRGSPGPGSRRPRRGVEEGVAGRARRSPPPVSAPTGQAREAGLRAGVAGAGRGARGRAPRTAPRAPRNEAQSPSRSWTSSVTGEAQAPPRPQRPAVERPMGRPAEREQRLGPQVAGDPPDHPARPAVHRLGAPVRAPPGEASKQRPEARLVGREQRHGRRRDPVRERGRRDARPPSARAGAAAASTSAAVAIRAASAPPRGRPSGSACPAPCAGEQLDQRRRWAAGRRGSPPRAPPPRWRRAPSRSWGSCRP